jgi:hypothetical protein
VPASQPPYQAISFQLTKPVDIADVYGKPVGDFEAYLEVPGKGACSLTGQAKVIGMEPQGGGVRFDLTNGGTLQCGSDAPRQVAANLVEEGDGASWLPPQVNLCTRWDGTDVAKHPKCLQRSVSAYWLDTGVVRIIGL